MDEFFAKYVRGRDEIPYNQFLSAAGLRLEQPDKTRVSFSGAGQKSLGYLGADLEDSGDFTNVKDVRAGTPAYDQGLNAKDKIVALNGTHLNKEGFEAAIAAKPGETVRLTVLRNESLRTLEIKLGVKSDLPYRILQLSSPTDDQKAIYQTWITDMSRGE
jgi:predicted metalloprotease with PDZ domain